MKVSNFMIALIVVGLVATTLTLTLIDYSVNYDTNYSQGSLDVFNQTQEIRELALDMQNNTAQPKPVKSGKVDIVGDYISKAIDTLKLATSSLDLFDSMTEEATNKIGLPPYFKIGFITIMIILIIVGVIVSAMIKKDV